MITNNPVLNYIIFFSVNLVCSVIVAAAVCSTFKDATESPLPEDQSITLRAIITAFNASALGLGVLVAFLLAYLTRISTTVPRMVFFYLIIVCGINLFALIGTRLDTDGAACKAVGFFTVFFIQYVCCYHSAISFLINQTVMIPNLFEPEKVKKIEILIYSLVTCTSFISAACLTGFGYVGKFSSSICWVSGNHIGLLYGCYLGTSIGKIPTTLFSMGTTFYKVYCVANPNTGAAAAAAHNKNGENNPVKNLRFLAMVLVGKAMSELAIEIVFHVYAFLCFTSKSTTGFTFAIVCVFYCGSPSVMLSVPFLFRKYFSPIVRKVFGDKETSTTTTSSSTTTAN